jgi:hypothetical protein
MANGKPFVPPGGFAGFAQMTPAVQANLRKKKTTTRKRRKKVATKKRPAARKKTAKKKGGPLVKGSAAAKARMAKLRKMRKK